MPLIITHTEYDNCFNEGLSGTPLISYERYKNMSDALNATERPILYSMCNWGEDQPWNWATVRSHVFFRNEVELTGVFLGLFRQLQIAGEFRVTSMMFVSSSAQQSILERSVDFSHRTLTGTTIDVHAHP